MALAVEQPAWGQVRVSCYCDAQDTFYVGTLKRVGRIHQQTFIDTYGKVAFAKLYTEKNRTPPRTCSMTGSYRSLQSTKSR